MGSSQTKEESSNYPKEKSIIIKNNRKNPITVLEISHDSDNYKKLTIVDQREIHICKVEYNRIIFIYVYPGSQIQTEPITKIKNCHLFNNNTYIDIN